MLSASTVSMSGKRLQLMQEMVPPLRRIAILANAADPITKPLVVETERTAASLGLGSAVLFAALRAGGQNLAVPKGQWPRLALLAFFNITLWNLLVVFGITMIPPLASTAAATASTSATENEHS